MKGNCYGNSTTCGLLILKIIGCYICEATVTYTTSIESVPELKLFYPDDTGLVMCKTLYSGIMACINGMDVQDDIDKDIQDDIDT